MFSRLLTLDERRCDLAEQSFHEARELDPARRAWICERRPLVEQAWLTMFGFALHSGLSPSLIRKGESLGAHRPPHASRAECGVESSDHRGSRNEMPPVPSSMLASWRMSRRVGARRPTRRRRFRAVV